jgi:hypothetical protein
VNELGLPPQVKAGAEKIVTNNRESHVVVINTNRLDCYHWLERERAHRLLIDDANRGLADIAAGRTFEADTALAQLQHRRKTAAKRSGLANAGKSTTKKCG